MNLITNTDYYADLMEIVRLFFPENFIDNDATIVINSQIFDDKVMVENSIQFNAKEFLFTKTYEIDSYFNSKKIIKISCYELLSQFFNIRKPWGALTGIRPSKLAHELLKSGMTKSQMVKFLKEKYFVSNRKINLIKKIVENQNSYISVNEKEIDFYVNIPFCVTRCSYCSFISALIGPCQNLIEPYIKALIKEINAAKQIIKDNNFKVKSVYIGGGTPTSFNENQLQKILEVLDFDVKEFTIEAGRPDTITKEKFDLFKKFKVTRICVNPQTFNDKVLKIIGRNHTSSDVENVYNLARQYPFKINMDFIAGLPNDTIEAFKRSIKKAVDLSADSITVHTLCLKRSSTFSNEQINIFNKSSKVSKMVDFAHNYLSKSGYQPYYMYRQKNMLENLENVSYAKNNSFSIFNIDSMEENATILACGANAITKRIFKENNRIERQANIKDIKEYITRVDEMIQKKRKLFPV